MGVNLNQYKHTQSILDTIQAIESETDKYGVFAAVSAFGEKFGFSTATVGQIVHPSLKNIEYADLGASDVPEEFQKRCIQGNYLLHDPVINRAYASQDAFTWPEVIETATKRGRRIIEEGRDFALFTGLTIPVHMGDRTPGIVSFAGESMELSSDDIGALELIGAHGYSRLLDIFEENQNPKPTRLTPREVDVLHYVACGKTDQEIGHILGLGHYSVKDHLANARRKLGAANRAHSVMIAIRDGHIMI